MIFDGKIKWYEPMSKGSHLSCCFRRKVCCAMGCTGCQQARAFPWDQLGHLRAGM